MSRNIFDHAKDLCTNKTPWTSLSEEDQKSWNTYMINKILSMNVDYIDVVDMVQMHSNMPPSAVHAFYCDLLPKGSYRFIPLLKKGGANKDQIEGVAGFLGVSKREARMYMTLLSEQDVVKMTEYYNHVKAPYETTKLKKGGTPKAKRATTRGRG